MPEHKLCVPCLFGLEGPLGNELRHMGLRSVMPENGRVRCTGTDADIARMNLRCRFGERVLLELGSFPAPTFDALFEGVKALRPSPSRATVWSRRCTPCPTARRSSKKPSSSRSSSAIM